MSKPRGKGVKPPTITREMLLKYEGKNLTITELSEALGEGYQLVLTSLQRYDLKHITKRVYKQKVSREILEKAVEMKLRKVAHISKEFGFSSTSIRDAITREGMEGKFGLATPYQKNPIGQKVGPDIYFTVQKVNCYRCKKELTREISIYAKNPRFLCTPCRDRATWVEHSVDSFDA